jgi:hypothetical protein
MRIYLTFSSISLEKQVQMIINQKAIEAPEAKKPWWRFW